MITLKKLSLDELNNLKVGDKIQAGDKLTISNSFYYYEIVAKHFGNLVAAKIDKKYKSVDSYQDFAPNANKDWYWYE